MSAFAIATLAGRLVLAQENAPVARPALSAAVRTTQIEIDGRIGESDWQNAAVATDFTQAFPRANDAATQRTEARVLYDAAAIYVAIPRLRLTPGFRRVATCQTRRDGDLQ